MADLPEIITDLKLQLSRRGGSAVRTLSKAFALNDTNRSGTFNFEEFEAICGKVGLFFKRQDLTKLFRHFDINGDERMAYAEFLRALQGTLSDRRCRIIRQIFDTLDVRGCGTVKLADIKGNYDAARHPKAMSGEMSVDAVFVELLNSFDGAGGQSGELSWPEFLDYYAEISATVPYNDDYFVMVCERVWGISETSKQAVSVPESLLVQIESVLREKVRQKTHSTGAEANTIRQAFKHFDLDESGYVSYDEFCYALERFGVFLDVNVSRALFNAFDVDNVGKVDYTEFAAVLYEKDVLSASYRAPTTGGEPAAGASTQQEPQKGSQQQQQSDAGASAASSVPQSTTAPRFNVIFVQGGPGAGKSTQCARLAQTLGCVHLRVDDILNAAQASNPQIAAVIAEHSAAQQPLPPELVVDLILQTFEQYGAAAASEGATTTTFLCDGFPSQRSSVDAWNAAVGDGRDSGVCVPFMLFVDVPEEELARRAAAAGVPTARYQQRFSAFLQSTMPVVETFAQQGKVRVVDGVGDPASVFAEAQTAFAE